MHNCNKKIYRKKMRRNRIIKKKILNEKNNYKWNNKMILITIITMMATMELEIKIKIKIIKIIINNQHKIQIYKNNNH